MFSCTARRRFGGSVAVPLCLAVVATCFGAGSAAAQEAPQTMVVVGDSYSSGEGLKPFEDPADPCHRSASQAYGSRAVEQMGGVRVANLACSGAKIDAYLPEEPGAPMAEQRSRTREFDPDYVALTLGGNDAEWSSVIRSCASGLGPFNDEIGIDDETDCKNRLDSGEKLVEDIAGRLHDVYVALLTDAPRAQVRVLLYPPLFPATTDSDGECIIGQARIPRTGRSVDITLSNGTTQRMIALEKRLNDSIVNAVGDLRAADPRAAARLDVVDTVAAFGGYDGHTVSCGREDRPTPWINQLSIDVEERTLSDASFHPRSDGQRAMGEALATAWAVRSPTPQPAAGTAEQGSAVAAANRGPGYWRASGNGGVTAFGTGAHQFGNLVGTPLNRPVVGMAVTPSDGGYWLLGADGGVFAFGDAPFRGAATERFDEDAVAIAADPSGNGYWVVAADGTVAAFGDAGSFGSAADHGALQSPVAGIAPTRTGQGYWLVTQDGAVLSFGDAADHGSMAGQQLNAAMVGITATPSGGGYWLAGADGGVFSFGDATFAGSAGEQPLQAPVVGIAASPSGAGYWMAAEDGAIFAFGAAPFLGR